MLKILLCSQSFFLGILLMVIGTLLLSNSSFAKDDTICINTAFVLIGASHKVCIYTFKDPLIPEITCKISHARTGGIEGTLGVAEDIARFSLSCVQTEEIKEIKK